MKKFTNIPISKGKDSRYDLTLEEANTETLDFSSILSKEEASKSIKKRGPRKERKIDAYTLDGVYITSYESTAQASLETGLSKEVIRRSCNGESLLSVASLMIFLYEDGDIEKRIQQLENRKTKNGILPINKTPVLEYSTKGKLLIEHTCLKHAAKYNKLPTIRVKKCCNGEILYIGDKIFLYKGTDINERLPQVKEALYQESIRRKHYKAINVYYLDGTFIKRFNSCTDACKEYRVNPSSVSLCCSGQRNVLTVNDKIFLSVGDSISERLKRIRSKKINYE